MLKSLSSSCLPASQRMGSLKMIWKRVHTRRTAVISFDLKRMRRQSCRGPNGLVVSARGALRPRRSAAFLRGPDGRGQGFGAACGLGVARDPG